MPPDEYDALLILTDATSKVFGAPSDEVAVHVGGGGAIAGGGGGTWAHSRETATKISVGQVRMFSGRRRRRAAGQIPSTHVANRDPRN